VRLPFLGSITTTDRKEREPFVPVSMPRLKVVAFKVLRTALNACSVLH
jgi:hypothetical protein